MRIKIRYYTCSSMFIIMLIIIPRITEREGWTSFSEKGTDRHERVVSTKLERCSTLYRLVASVDLHNYRARFETAEFLKKKRKNRPRFFHPFSHSFLSSSFFLDSILFPGWKNSGGRKNCINNRLEEKRILNIEIYLQNIFMYLRFNY